MAHHAHTLLGFYATPPFEYGVVTCEIRGDARIVGLSQAPIPWPIGQKAHGKNKRQRFLILYDALVDAVRQESASAVAHWRGVGMDTVWRWRKALGVGGNNEGTLKLKSSVHAEHLVDARAAARPTPTSPERREKIAAARRGKSRPPEVGRAIGLAHLGKNLSAETRRKMGEAHRARGTGGPGRAWSAEEDELVRTLPPQEVARRTGRPVTAVWSRRRKLKVNPAGEPEEA